MEWLSTCSACQLVCVPEHVHVCAADELSCFSLFPAVFLHLFLASALQPVPSSCDAISPVAVLILLNLGAVDKQLLWFSCLLSCLVAT